MLKRGDTVLVPFPFTNLTREKVRPAVVISAKNDVDVSVALDIKLKIAFGIE
jgi:hypothetical protein